MDSIVFGGLLIPFLGTVFGSACVFFMRKSPSGPFCKALTGFAAGVMIAASVWSLLIPSMDLASHMGRWSVVPAVTGFWIGVLFLLALDRIIPHLHQNSNKPEGLVSKLRNTTMLMLAVTLHNIPEGMAVGVVYTGFITNSTEISSAGALALAIGISIQNFPEGALISLPLNANGFSKRKAFGCGILSGIVEPIGSIMTILATGYVLPILPYFLSFAAGAMFYVVIEELIPEMSSGTHSNVGTVALAFGFTLMMALDVALG